MTKTHAEEKSRVAAALRRYGYQSQSYNILLRDKLYFFSQQGIDGAIAYIVRAGVALGAGDPVCAPEDMKEFVSEFRDYCKSRRWRCCFQSISDRCEQVLDDLGFSSLKIGEEPIFDLTRLSWAGSDFRGLRHDINQARRHGMTVTEYRPLEERNPERKRQMEELSLIWQKFKESGEFSFLIGEPGLDDPGDRKYFLALLENELQAFVVCTPIYARKGIYFDLMRRKEKPLSGTAQLLITESFQMLRDQGYKMASLGAVPLSNEEIDDPELSLIVELSLEFAFNYLGHFHRYKPLYQFKDQFGPTAWEARFLAYWPPRFHPVILYALLKAYDPHAVTGNLRKQLQATWAGIKWLGQAPRDVLDRLIDIRRS